MRTLQIFLWLTIISVSQSSFSANNNILVFGDSLSAAYNVDADKGWVSLLEQQLKQKQPQLNIINASISGETSSGGLVRFESQIQKSAPDIVILELGANDGLRGFDLTITRSNLIAMINMSHQANAHVILAGIHIPPNYGRTYTKKFDQIYTDLAKIENVSLIPFLLEGIATKSELMLSDGLHPNEEGQKIIVENVLPYLLPLIKKPPF